MTTEYYEINIPSSPGVPQEVTNAFVEVHEHLIRISERLNDLEDLIINWEKTAASSITLEAGTSTDEVDDLRIAGDGSFYHITEAAATPGIDLIVDFDSVTEFRLVRIMAIYDGSASHACAVQLYNRSTRTWDTFESVQHSQEDVTNAGEYILENLSFFVPDASNYIGGGNVRVRIHHTMGGNASHDLYIDVIALYW